MCTNLGFALAATPGRLTDAIAQFEAAVRLAPDDPGTHVDLGLALAQIPERREEAAAEYEEALRLNPDLEFAREKLIQLRSAQP